MIGYEFLRTASFKIEIFFLILEVYSRALISGNKVSRACHSGKTIVPEYQEIYLQNSFDFYKNKAESQI